MTWRCRPTRRPQRRAHLKYLQRSLVVGKHARRLWRQTPARGAAGRLVWGRSAAAPGSEGSSWPSPRRSSAGANRNSAATGTPNAASIQKQGRQPITDAAWPYMYPGPTPGSGLRALARARVAQLAACCRPPARPAGSCARCSWLGRRRGRRRRGRRTRGAQGCPAPAQARAGGEGPRTGGHAHAGEQGEQREPERLLLRRRHVVHERPRQRHQRRLACGPAGRPPQPGRTLQRVARARSGATPLQRPPAAGRGRAHRRP